MKLSLQENLRFGSKNLQFLIFIAQIKSAINQFRKEKLK